MKKTCILLSLLLALCTISFAKEVSVNTAKTVGYNYLLQHGISALYNSNDLKLVYTSGTSPAYFYIFSGTDCFVIVSAEDAVMPVLGYSKERLFQGDNVPPSVTGFFESYKNQIAYVISNNVAATKEIATNWDNLVQNKSTSTGKYERTTSVPPLLTTTWNQTQYYNDYCPSDAAAPYGYNSRCPTGCVATAMAQVMKYWAWPATGIGTHSYSTSSYGTLSANFGITTYNWSGMPNNVTGVNASVARLMSDLGVSVDMQYTANESGAYVIAAGSPILNSSEYALKVYFNYKNTLQGVQRLSYSDPNWINLIEAEVNASRPVLYTGDGTSGGHCFVVDGYDASNNFHINWGWGGSGPDGYYYMNSLNPPALGAGGGAGGFNNDQTAIIGIQPSASAPTTNLKLYDNVNLTRSSIGYIDTFCMFTNILNSGSTTFNGDFCFVAYDATTGAVVSYLDSIIGASLPAGYVYGPPGIGYSGVNSVAMVPGSYNIKIMYRNSGTTSWLAVPDNSPYVNTSSISVYNHNFIEIYSSMSLTPTTLVQGSAASVALTAYNYSSTAWNDSMYLGIYNLDGTWNCDVQEKGVTPIGAYGTSGTMTFSTSNVTSTPGTYILVLWFKYAGGWYLCGADYDQNPVYINVVAAPTGADIYEANNTAGAAYNLSSTLSWVSNHANTSTPGSNIHITSDQDYYKVVLPVGYNYSITARVNDAVSTDDASSYTGDVLWSYSTDGGSTWSSTYNNTMTGTINTTGGTGGTVIFHVSPAVAGNMGTYLFKINDIARTVVTTTLPDVNLSAATIFPNPASGVINVDLSGTGTKGIEATFTDMQGKTALSADIRDQPVAVIPVSSLAPGIYFMSVTTEAGMINKKITVSK